MTTTHARRHFLRTAAGMAAGGVLPSLGIPLASLAALASQACHAADLSGPYKAIVCLFMQGGCDTHNWVVPTDATGYAQYAAARGDLAWPLQKLQPISVTSQAAGRSFGMPEELAPLRKWYESGQAAIVANVGTLLRPITRADYQRRLALALSGTARFDPPGYCPSALVVSSGAGSGAAGAADFG